MSFELKSVAGRTILYVMAVDASTVPPSVPGSHR